MDLQTLTKAKNWASSSALTANERTEIQKLITGHEQGDTAQSSELSDRFYKDLEFGTGGLRGVYGLGTNRLNRYTVRRTAKALAEILQTHSKGLSKLKVAVGYDTRRGSREFAEEFCKVLASDAITCYLSQKVIPVPLLSFSIRHHQCDAGIMITASHNPRIYNGIKVYWNDGCQVTPPHDQLMIEAYNRIESFEDIAFVACEEARQNGLLLDLPEATLEKFHQLLLARSLNPDLCRQRGGELKIIYTPLHGAGAAPCQKALALLGLSQVKVVKEQEQPDPDFSSLNVPPNPENPEALKLAVDMMKRDRAHIVFGTDPDSDRLGVVITHRDDSIHYLNGNQLAVLLLHYILHHKQERGELTSKSLVIKTIVTTPMMEMLCKEFHVHYENTLTGFKWMCGLMGQWEKQGRDFDFVFACEESFGYLPHDLCRDKDGVGAMSFVAEMTLWYLVQGKTLIDALDDIYTKFGLCYESLVSKDYYGQAGAMKIQRIMDHFRKSAFTHFAGERILTKEDYERPIPGSDLPASNVIGLILESGNKLYLRPSGTEPKIKFYLMVKQEQGSLEQKKQGALSLLKKYEEAINHITESGVM